MKILLLRYHDNGNINTRIPDCINKFQGILPPLGIAYVAAVLEAAKYEVKILDAMAFNLTSAETLTIIQREAPDIVGITAMISNVRGALEAAALAKRTKAIVVMGGPLLSVFPNEILSYDFIDYGIIGEGEQPMLELVHRLEHRLPVYDIKGLVYRENGQIRKNEPCLVDNLDTLPFPARHLLPMERYSYIIAQHPMTTMITSRGCPFQCGFCIKAPSDKKHRRRSPGNVVDEMESVLEKYSVKEIMFYDDTLTLKRDFVIGMCEEILLRDLRVKWESPTRIDCIDEQLLKIMHRAGCIRLRYGVESGDYDILKLMNKGIDLERVKEVFRLTRKAKIETFAYFIIGYLHDTPQTMGRTIALSRDIDADATLFTIATPYPMTPLFEMAQNEGLVDGDYWREFVLGLRDDRLPYLVPDAQKWFRKAYTDFYFRPKYLLRKFLKMRSLLDIRNNFQVAKSFFYFNINKSNNS